MSELIGNLATSRNAMMAQLHALSAVSNNIANANTIGYKTEEVSFHTLVSQPVGQYGVKGVEGSTATAVKPNHVPWHAGTNCYACGATGDAQTDGTATRYCCTWAWVFSSSIQSHSIW